MRLFESKKLIGLTAAVTLLTGVLTGCGSSNEVATNATDNNNTAAITEAANCYGRSVGTLDLSR